MAKKFGKILLFAAAAGSAATALCLYMQKKATVRTLTQESADQADSDEAPKRASAKAEKKETETSRSYVPLHTEPSADAAPKSETDDTRTADADPAAAKENGPKEDPLFTPLSEQAAKPEETAEETVEEFFGEDEDT